MILWGAHNLCNSNAKLITSHLLLGFKLKRNTHGQKNLSLNSLHQSIQFQDSILGKKKIQIQ